MIHFIQAIDGKLSLGLDDKQRPSLKKSNPKQATQRAVVGWLFILGLLLPLNSWAASSRFVSLSLCSDRLLLELATPEQIVAMSLYSTNPQLMLDKTNTNYPTVDAKLSKLLPYISATILLNETFYPQLVSRLKSLDFHVVGINDNPQTPEELIALITQLGDLINQPEKAQQLIQQIKQTTQTAKAHQHQFPKPVSTLLLGENGLVNTTLPQTKTLLQLLNLDDALQGQTQSPNMPLESLILSRPALLMTFPYEVNGDNYSDAAQSLQHPALKRLATQIPHIALPAKYTYCFDHGVWQGINHYLQQTSTRENTP